MRGVQRGITTTFIVLVILAGTIAITSVYINYYLSQKQKVSEINSFEDCAKHYPVMESYPEQCATPDGKHFTRQRSEEEKQKQLNPPSSPVSLDVAKWKDLDNSVFGYSLKYPPSWELDLKQDEENSEITKIGPPDSFGFSFTSQHDPIDKSIDLSSDVTDVNISFSKGKMYKTKNTGVAGTKYRIDLFFDFSPFHHHIILSSWMEDEEFLNELADKLISNIRISVR